MGHPAFLLVRIKSLLGQRFAARRAWRSGRRLPARPPHGSHGRRQRMMGPSGWISVSYAGIGLGAGRGRVPRLAGLPRERERPVRHQVCPCPSGTGHGGSRLRKLLHQVGSVGRFRITRLVGPVGLDPRSFIVRHLAPAHVHRVSQAHARGPGAAARSICATPRTCPADSACRTAAPTFIRVAADHHATLSKHAGGRKPDGAATVVAELQAAIDIVCPAPRSGGFPTRLYRRSL